MGGARRRGAWVAAAALLAARAGAAEITVDAGRGPVKVRLPPAASPQVASPLVVLLHSFRGSGVDEEWYLALSSRLAAAGYLYALPDGTLDRDGNRYWNGTDACCDRYRVGVDDVGYLVALLDAVDRRYRVDPRAVFFVGHSNGAFMAYAVACARADRVTGIVSMGGAVWDDPKDCVPSRPVRVLEVHGTADTTIDYEGGFYFALYPGARQSALRWAAANGCAATPLPGVAFDLDSDLPGSETSVLEWQVGCSTGGVELWTIQGGEHVPALTATFRDRLLAWLGESRGSLFADGFEGGSLARWSFAGSEP